MPTHAEGALRGGVSRVKLESHLILWDTWHENSGIMPTHPEGRRPAEISSCYPQLTFEGNCITVHRRFSGAMERFFLAISASTHVICAIGNR